MAKRVAGVVAGLAERIDKLADALAEMLMRSARRGVLGSRFASPHAVRRSLTDALQSPALFGGVFRCARPDYRRLTPQITKRRQIPFP